MALLRTFLLVTLALVATALAAPLGVNQDYAIHEKRNIVPQGWVRRGRLNSRMKLPMRIALKQSNLDRLEEHLMAVSHPESLEYGQHWTPAQIAKSFAPSRETVDAVSQWLVQAGVSTERQSRSASLGWLSFEATVEEAERLLRTEYWVWEHEPSQTPHVAATHYSLPTSIRDHIDFVTPTLHFDRRIPGKDQEKRDVQKRDATNSRWGPGSTVLPKFRFNPGYKNIIDELSHCDTDITPNCLRTLYKIPPGLTKNPQNSLGIVEYSPQSFVPSDLDLFFSNFSRNQVQKRPNFVAIDGGYLNETQDLDLNLESNLDLQFAMALVNPVEVTLYQVGDIEGNASFNDFLDAFDASYCAGDDPSQDMSYPDSAPGGYDKPKQCGGVEQTKVISTSYGYNEVDLTPAYEQRQCNEYAKLGLAGTTFVFSSGDYGVAGNGNMCVSDTTGQLQSGKLGGVFTPGFPGGCPYVLSVGATQINPNTSVLAPESACNQVIYSGGGFSNVFSIPTYQKTAVSSWFAQHKPSTYSSKQYNDSGVTRGFPDVSANGARYVVAIDGGYKYHVYGTSASAPTFASVLTLINEARLNVGKPTVGFVNPALYANPSMLNDITSGFNPGCNTKGFEAVQGWDPVTGLGTPNYPKMLEYFLTH